MSILILTRGEREDALLLWVETKTLGGTKRIFSHIHKAKHILLPKKNNSVHALLDSCGYPLLGEHFVSHIHLTYYVFSITYPFNGAKGLIQLML